MNENSDLLPDLLHEEFKVEVRGYSRRQVDEFVAECDRLLRDREQRLNRALDEAEHLRRELSTARQQALNGRPAYQEVSENVRKILQHADDEARAQMEKANEEISRFRGEALAEIDRMRADARDQSERILTAAQEQADRTVAAARGEADKARTSARAEADRLTEDARTKAETALASAKAQSKRMLDEVTARASAIHDGAERRLNLLSTRHGETIRRLSDILEGVSGLVAAETARPSLEDEVALSVAKAIGGRHAEISDGAEGLSALAGPSPLAPPHPSTRVNGPGAPPADLTGMQGAAATARSLGRGPRQAGGPSAAPSPLTSPAAAPPGATRSPLTGPAGAPSLASPPPLTGPTAAPPVAIPSRLTGPSAAAPSTSVAGDTAGPVARSGGAEAVTTDPRTDGGDQAGRGVPRGPTTSANGDHDEPTDGMRILPG